jgi:hypothetical protein
MPVAIYSRPCPCLTLLPSLPHLDADIACSLGGSNSARHILPVYVGVTLRELEDGINSHAWDADWAKMYQHDSDRAARVCRQRWYDNLQQLLSIQGIDAAHRGWPRKDDDLEHCVVRRITQLVSSV